MLNFSKGLIIIMFLYSFAGFAKDQIISTDDFNTLKKILCQVDTNTLVIFDADDVLIAPTDDFMFKNPIRKQITDKLKQKYNKDQMKQLISIIFERRTVRLVESQMPCLIENLQKQQISTIVLTNWWTGKFGNIKHMEDYRFRGLDDVWLSFTATNPFPKDFELPSLATEDGIPMQKKGVLMTAMADKGAVLQSALPNANRPFKMIVMIDDDMHNLESVKKVCKIMQIEFIGIHYTAANKIPLPKLVLEKEELRYHILETESVWLLSNELDKRFKRYQRHKL